MFRGTLLYQIKGNTELLRIARTHAKTAIMTCQFWKADGHVRIKNNYATGAETPPYQSRNISVGQKRDGGSMRRLPEFEI